MGKFLIFQAFTLASICVCLAVPVDYTNGEDEQVQTSQSDSKGGIASRYQVDEQSQREEDEIRRVTGKATGFGQKLQQGTQSSQAYAKQYGTQLEQQSYRGNGAGELGRGQSNSGFGYQGIDQNGGFESSQQSQSRQQSQSQQQQGSSGYFGQTEFGFENTKGYNQGNSFSQNGQGQFQIKGPLQQTGIGKNLQGGGNGYQQPPYGFGQDKKFDYAGEGYPGRGFEFGPEFNPEFLRGRLEEGIEFDRDYGVKFNREGPGGFVGKPPRPPKYF